MLVLSRKQSQQILIGTDISITVVKIDGNHVRLGIKAPREVPILRAELDDGANDGELAARIDPVARASLPGDRNHRGGSAGRLSRHRRADHFGPFLAPPSRSAPPENARCAASPTANASRLSPIFVVTVPLRTWDTRRSERRCKGCSCRHRRRSTPPWFQIQLHVLCSCSLGRHASWSSGLNFAGVRSSTA